MAENNSLFKKDNRNYLLPFLLVSTLFFMWGVANNMTDTLLAAFKRIMSMSDFQTSLIQFSFYGAYFCFALPTAILISKYSYKTGIIIGLLLYAGGTMLFYPAAQMGSYLFYLFAIYIMAGGCSILETTANPYVMAMGPHQTATRRLNIAQIFNPVGSLSGIIISSHFILSELSNAGESDRNNMTEDALKALQYHELSAITWTYMTLGLILLTILVVMLFSKMPKFNDKFKFQNIGGTFKRLYKDKTYRYGVVAQFFYVGAQISVWSYTIRFVMKELGVLEQDASVYYLMSIIGFTIARFVFTTLMKYFRPSTLMVFASVCAVISCVSVILFSGITAVIMLIAISLFMSLMFPTIYGMALCNISEDDVKIGASGLIMSILGGAVLTPLQGYISDLYGVQISYIVPLVCFTVILIYGMASTKNNKIAH